MKVCLDTGGDFRRSRSPALTHPFWAMLGVATRVREQFDPARLAYGPTPIELGAGFNDWADTVWDVCDSRPAGRIQEGPDFEQIIQRRSKE